MTYRIKGEKCTDKKLHLENICISITDVEMYNYMYIVVNYNCYSCFDLCSTEKKNYANIMRANFVFVLLVVIKKN